MLLRGLRLCEQSPVYALGVRLSRNRKKSEGIKRFHYHEIPASAGMTFAFVLFFINAFAGMTLLFLIRLFKPAFR